MKKAVLVISALVAVLVVAAVVAWQVVDSDRIKQRLETGLGEALAMEVRIDGPLRFGLLPGPRVVVTDVEVTRDGEAVAIVEGASVRLAFPSLLLGRMRLLDVAVERPELWIERYRPGVYNIRDPESEPGELKALWLPRLRVSDARLNYRDHGSELEWLLEHCDLVLRDVAHSGGLPRHAAASLAASGELRCQALRQGQFTAAELFAGVHGSNGRFDLEPVTATVFDGHAAGRIEADFSAGAPAYQLEHKLSGFDLGTFMTQLEPAQETAGKLDLDLSLIGRGRTWQEVRNSAAGTLSLSAGELTLHGYDLDDELDGYAATQRFNLIDVGAVLLAGPIGLVVTRGHKFASLLHGTGGTTVIEQMVSEWTVEGGVAEARDVALRTAENRIALAGALDFGEYRFEDLRAAVIDVDGCALVEQRITGPFRAPEIEQPNILVTVIGPLLDLVKSGVQAISGADCKIFYSGSIVHPE